MEAAAESAYEMTCESSYDLDQLIFALDRLPARERESIVLFELSGLSLKEIQEIQGGTLSGVKSRMSRARAKLKLLLASDYPSLRSISHAESNAFFNPGSIRLQEL